MAAAGALNPLELADVRATESRLAHIAKETLGSIHWLSDGIPSVRRVAPERRTSGRNWIGLVSNGWLATGFVSQLVLIMAVLFQQEIRRALAQIGRLGFSNHSLTAMDESRTLEEIIRAVVPLADDHIGAILVLERESELWDIVELGVPLEAKVSRELLTSIFMPQSPLHDGAVVIRKDRVVAAGCFLPLNLDPDLGRMLGTRHRAALGVTEESDAVVITVSEESGAISVIMSGNMMTDLDAASLRKLLARIFLNENRKTVEWSERIKAYFPIRSKKGGPIL